MASSIEWRGDKIAKEVRKALDVALIDAAEHVLEHANRTVPIEEGTLGRSGHVPPIERASNGSRARVVYDTPYAVMQHERTDLRHDEGRRAKWLQLTINEQTPQVRRFIIDQVRKALR